MLHLLDAVEGFERADEDAPTDARDFSADIKHEVIAVTKVHVGVASAHKHGTIARGWTAKVMSGGIALRIGFGFHDTTAEADTGEFANDDFVDEKAGQGDGIRRQFGAAKAADGNGSFTGLGGWQARQSSGAVRKSNLTPDQVIPPAGQDTNSRRKLMEPDKREHIRKRTDQLLYAEFGPENGSILLNLSEEGCSFQSIAPVRAEHVRFSVSVGDGHKLEGDGHMVWSDPKKKTGGVRFLNPSQQLREQVRAWLNQTQVTTDGKLDPRAVESPAKQRRRKLREEARAEAERARKRGALKENREAPGADTRPEQEARPPGDPSTKETPNPLSGGDSTSGAAFGNSAVTSRRIGMIAVGAMLLMTLVNYRRELGHLVMSVGSCIAGEKGGTATPAPVAASPEVKAAVIPAAQETSNESSADAADAATGGETVQAEFTRPAETPAAAPAKRVPPHQERLVEDVASLWTSVENGDTGAEVTLASRYVRGEGVPQSCAQARVLLEAAVKRGSSEAKQSLGELGQAGCP